MSDKVFSGARRFRVVQLLGLALVTTAAVMAFLPVRAEASTPTVTLAPGPTAGGYADQATVAVSVAANSLFTPGATINVIECADPGGTVGNLPQDVSTCDGTTVQGNSVFVASDGSLSVTGYPLYTLPSPLLGENPGGQPKCDATDECVLYVGQDQNDFTQPKVFSAPFFMTGGGFPSTTTTTGGTTTTTSGSTTTTSGATTTTTSGSTTTTSGGTTTTTSGGTTTTTGHGGSTTTTGHGSTTTSGGGATTTTSGGGAVTTVGSNDGGGGSTLSSSGSGGGSSGTLAFTGGAAPLLWMAIAGLVLIGLGDIGRRFAVLRASP